jgi:hypothetical protein
MGPLGCPETSVANYQLMLRNIPEREDFLYTIAEAWNHAQPFKP